jgi:phosphoribosylaminoimidazole-succinocarboxamide synthase
MESDNSRSGAVATADSALPGDWERATYVPPLFGSATRGRVRFRESGKVRDIYEIPGDATGIGGSGTQEKIVLVASDRMSAFDAVLSDQIPGKGLVLTALTKFWLDHLQDVPHHLVAWRASDLPGDISHLAGRAITVKKLRMIPLECVVRGYITGSAWDEYQRTGRVGGESMPEGMRFADPFPEPLFTPALKCQSGDQNLTAPAAARLVGSGLFEDLRRYSIGIYNRAARIARSRGVMIADTKFEFGFDQAGELVLADEVLTPDSSRFWLAESWSPGKVPLSFDRQEIKVWLTSQGWSRRTPAPRLPARIVQRTAGLYQEVYERLSNQSIEDWVGAARR